MIKIDNKKEVYTERSNENYGQLLDNLISYFNKDMDSLAKELTELLNKGMSFEKAYNFICNNHGFERSFYEKQMIMKDGL